MGDPQMLAACEATTCRDASFYQHIERFLQFEPSLPATPLARAWRILVASRLERFSEDRGVRWYSVIARVKALDIDRHVREAVIKVVRPRIEVGSPFVASSAVDGLARTLTRLEDLIHVRFSSEGHPPVQEILREWPSDIGHETDLLRSAEHALAEALDQAKDAGYLDRVDLASLDVRFVSSGGDDDLGRGFLPIVRLIAALWDRIAAKDGATTRVLAAPWSFGAYLLQKRLHLHALANAVLDGSEVLPSLRTLDDRTFWVTEARNEIGRLVQARWTDIPSSDRSELEAKMRGGPPRSLARDETVTDGDWALVRDHALFQMLEPVRRSGGLLQSQTLEALDGVRRLYPDLSPRQPEDDGTRSVSAGSLRGYPERLSDIADEALLHAALALPRADWFGEADVWQMLCDADPRRALRALSTAPDTPERWRPEAISTLLASTEKVHDDALEAQLADLLAGLPREAMLANASATASWLRERGASARSRRTGLPLRLLAVCRHLTRSLLVPEAPERPRAANREPPLDAALNSPGGYAALAILGLLNAGQFRRGAGFGGEVLGLLDELVNAQGQEGLNARVLLVRDLAFFDEVDNPWTSQRLVPLLVPGTPEADVLWRVRAGNRVGSARLLNSLKPAFVREIVRRDLSHHQAVGLTNDLMQAAFWLMDSAAKDLDLNFSEVRQLLAESAPAVRTAAAHMLLLWMDPPGVTDFDRAAHWRTKVGPFFDLAWPLDARTREAGSSQLLARIAVKCGEAFPEAVAALEPFIVPWDVVSIDIGLTNDPEGKEVTARHPVVYLRLLSASIDPGCARPPSDLGVVLDRLAAAKPEISHERPYVRLDAIRRRLES